MTRPTSHRTYQGTGAITHRTDYEHLGKVLAVKRQLADDDLTQQVAKSVLPDAFWRAQ